MNKRYLKPSIEAVLIQSEAVLGLTVSTGGAGESNGGEAGAKGTSSDDWEDD